MKKIAILLTLILACGPLAEPASAQFTPQATAIAGSAPEGIGYQGRLEDGGFPVNATKSMVFRVYTAVSGGALLWTSPAQNVSVSLGLFNAVVPVPVTTLVGGGARYLEVQIDGTIMSPRELLNSVPYALIAKSVEGTIDVSTAGLAINANSAATQPALYISSVTGNVGVGTGSPITAFDVGGSAQFGSGSTKSTFTAAGALNTAGRITAPDYTATYGILATTATFTNVQMTTGTARQTFKIGLNGGSEISTAQGFEYRNFAGTHVNWDLSAGAFFFDRIAGTQGGFDFSWSGTNFEMGTADGGTTLSLKTAGTRAAFIDGSQRIGVGTSLPASKLHLSSGTLTIDGNTATALTTIGSVGVGTALPASKLHMSSGTLTIDGNTANSLTTTGNVGVGTSSPATPLDVNGSAQFGSGAAKSTFTAAGFLQLVGGTGSLLVGRDNDIPVVGLGKTSPVALDAFATTLHIHNENAGYNPAGVKMTNAEAGSTATDGFEVYIDNAEQARLMMHENSPMILSTNGLERVRVGADGSVGIGTDSPASKLHMSSGTIIVDGNAVTALTTVGNAGIGTDGFTPNDRLEVAGGNVRLTAVAGSNGSVKLFSMLTVGAVTCTAQCGANTFCLAAWDSAGVASTCGTAAAANRCLCSGFGN